MPSRSNSKGQLQKNHCFQPTPAVSPQTQPTSLRSEGRETGLRAGSRAEVREGGPACPVGCFPGLSARSQFSSRFQGSQQVGSASELRSQAALCCSPLRTTPRAAGSSLPEMREGASTGGRHGPERRGLKEPGCAQGPPAPAPTRLGPMSLPRAPQLPECPLLVLVDKTLFPTSLNPVKQDEQCPSYLKAQYIPKVECVAWYKTMNI